MQNNFCRHISNSLFLKVLPDNRLTASPCCYFLNEKQLVDFNDILAYKKEIVSLSTFDSGHCNKCKFREQSEFRESIRQQSFKLIPNTAGTDLVNLELQIDNECNAACIMCSEQFSSQWKKLNLKQKKVYDIVPSTSVEDHFHTFLKHLDLTKLQKLKILGGEPFYNKVHSNILQLIPHPENVTLQYVTNGSIFPEQSIIDSWKKFHKVVLVVSIDDIEQRYEYVRWPLKWHQLDKNLKSFVDLQKTINCKIFVNCTLNPLTIYYMKNLEQYLGLVFGQENLDNHLRYDYAGFSNVNLSYCPENLSRDVIEKFGESHTISKILKTLSLEKNYRMIEWLENQENIRKCDSWKDVFPEIVHYFDS
jgi:wyosine [tRNA(Phe)-imidazoG37] synthetase (radical SAM superfamily)